MGVYIKGMEMPKQGRVTLQIGADGVVYVVDKYEITAEKYEKNFEVFEVPLNGRLIDANELGLTDFEIIMCNGDYKKGLEMLAKKFENALIISPADKDGE